MASHFAKNQYKPQMKRFVKISMLFVAALLLLSKNCFAFLLRSSINPFNKWGEILLINNG